MCPMYGVKVSISVAQMALNTYLFDLVLESVWFEACEIMR